MAFKTIDMSAAAFNLSTSLWRLPCQIRSKNGDKIRRVSNNLVGHFFLELEICQAAISEEGIFKISTCLTRIKYISGYWWTMKDMIRIQ